MDLDRATLTPPPPCMAPQTGSGPDELTGRMPPSGPEAHTATSAGFQSPRAGEGPAHPPLFAQDEVLAGRYRVLRFLARGGMGEVYEVLDLDLGERIALKTLGPTQAQSEHAIQRFKRELSLARKVTHPNVCRTYDLFHHEDEGRRVACLSMELLEGETLAARLFREKPLPPELARDLAQQICAALQAAHLAGVVHRDLKPSNVMLVPGSSGARHLRAVVTDFGLAFSETSRDQSGNFLGTPAYMSPEQVAGGEISFPSDVYSFGLILFEMLTGHPAFQGSSPLSTATRRLNEPAPSPRAFLPDLDEAWVPLLATCLALDPKDRYPTAGDLAAALEPEPHFQFPALPKSPRALRTFSLAAAVTLGVAGVGYGAWNLAKGRAPWAAPAPKPRPVVAILGFRNLGPEGMSWKGTAVAEMLGTDLGLDGRVRVISGDDVAQMKTDLGLPDNRSMDRETLAAIRKRLGADLLVLGSFLNSGSGDDFRIDMKLVDTRTGRLVGQLRQEGRDRDMLALVHGATQTLRKSMGLHQETSGRTEGLAATYPKDSEGVRLYALALEKLRRGEALASIALLEQAQARDASCALVHTALAEAWGQLGYDDKALEEARAAAGCSAFLNQEERLRVEAQLAVASRHWGRATEFYRRLYGLFPDNLDYGLRLAAALREGSQAQAGEKVLAELAKSDDEDPRVWSEAAELARAAGGLPRSLDLAEKAIRAAKQSGALHLAARIQIRRASTGSLLGRLDEAGRDLDAAEAAFSKEGDAQGQGAVFYARALNGFWSGAYDEARACALNLERVAQSMGNRKLHGIAPYLEGLMDLEQGACNRAIRRFDLAEERLEAAGDRRHILIPIMQRARAMAYQGRLRETRQQVEAGLSRIRQNGNDRHRSFLLGLLGGLELTEGRLPTAEAQLQEGLALGRKGALGEELIVLLELDARLQLWKGNLEGSGGALKEAKRVLEGHPYRAGLAEAMLLESVLKLEYGLPGEAIPLIRQADSIFAALRIPDGASRASLLASRANLDLGDPALAKAKLEAAKLRMRHTESCELRIEAALQEGRIAAAQRRGTDARRCFNTAEGLARKVGHIPLQLECRFLKAALNPPPGESMQEVAVVAAHQGFGLFLNRVRSGFPYMKTKS